MRFIGVEVEQETSVPYLKKKSWIRPCHGLKNDEYYVSSWLKKDVYYMSNVLVSPHGLKNDEYYVSS